MSEIKVDKISPQSGTELTLGDTSDDFLLPSGAEIKAKSGSTITVESGATITNSGTATGFGGTTAGTVTASTSGTSIDFTGIPSGTKRIDVIFNGVSPTLSGGDSNLKVQLGDAGGFETSSYVSKSIETQSGSQSLASEVIGFVIYMGASGTTLMGVMSLYLIDATNFDWISTHTFGKVTAESISCGGGTKSLSAELTQVRITSAGAFDAGEVNIHYWQ